MTITKQENAELAKLMLRESYSEERAREEAHRALPQDEQPYMVVCFGMLDYRVLWVSPIGDPEGEAKAERELAFWQEKARQGHLRVAPLSSNVSEHDFQVRQQWDLDALSKAIHESYR